MDRSETVKMAALSLYAELQAAGVDVIVDDRPLRPGAMFADWELIGVPHRVVLGDRGLQQGQVEYQGRRDAAAVLWDLNEAVSHVKAKLAASH
jgi:prolyl-tRNA synthetase